MRPDRPGEEPEAGNAGQKARATEPEVPEEELAPEDDAVIGRVFTRSLKVLAALAAAALIVVALRYMFRAGPEEAVEIPVAAPRAVEAAPRDVPVVPFTDITAEAGIDFVHVNGAAGEALLPETMGAGGAFLDFDRDGDQDLLLVNSTTWDAVLPDGEVEPATGPTMSLYENDGAGRFADRTAGSGLEVSFYGTGVAVGDVDGDGWTDIFISAVGLNRLFRNVEGARFEDVTAAAGVGAAATEWSSSSAFFDADGDGDLDLLVGNYVRWSRDIDIEVGYQLTGVGRAYGPPLNYGGTTMDLYRNDGSGAFTDVSEEAGLHILNPATDTPVAKTLGLAPVDIEGDGDIDVVVANDTVRNFLLVNDGSGGFTEDGELYGLAYGRDGAATGAMGADAADFRNDGELGFAIANFANEMTSLYVSQGDPTLWSDEAITAGIGAPSRRVLSFGLFFFDYDLDGRLDLLQVNGHLEDDIEVVEPSQQYRQAPQLFWNAGPAASATFVPVEPAPGDGLTVELVGRGSSYADIDGDGDLDVLLLQTGDRPLLLRNDQETGHRWLRFLLRGDGERVNRDAIGAWVEVEQRTAAGPVVQRRRVMPTRSYQSQVEPVVTIGLGVAASVDELTRVEVLWPDGSRQAVDVDGLDRVVEVQYAPAN
ncbi:MAG: CRTAC1 family protein [Holophagales bacterium]|nr:CRTAC1 family protein [Holophagales bacterium]MYD23711.1 CRTAC1 family protein [Holophagales bacterium]MYI33394.1 CRTAC1 family protein [Holophagales bacterium]